MLYAISRLFMLLIFPPPLAMAITRQANEYSRRYTRLAT